MRRGHRRVLIIGINYAPEIISIAVYTTATAQFLAAHCIHVDVVTAQPYFPNWRVFPGWPRFWYRSERPQELLSVTHCPTYVPRYPTGARRVLHHLSFALASLPVALWKAMRQRPDVVVVIAPSLVSGVTGWLAGRLCRARTWLHVQDLEVDAAFATGLLAKAGLMGRAARRFENWILRRFDRVSSISAPMLAKLGAKGVAPARLYELRNWANLTRVQPIVGPSPMRAELGITTRHVALYAGNLANKQGLEILPDLARRLAHRSDLTIVVCGEGALHRRLAELSQDLTNIRFLPLQPVERLGEMLTMADVHLLPQLAAAADLMLPSKLTNMLASGRPVIATASPDTALGREVDGCGVLTPPGDAAAFARALDQLLLNDELCATLGRKARERAVDRWDGDVILSRFLQEIKAL